MEVEYFQPSKSTCGSSDGSTEDIETLMRKPADLESPEILENYIHEIMDKKISTKTEVESLIKQLNRKYHISGSCLKLLYVYRNMCSKGKLKYDVRYEELFQSKGFRSQSGVLVVAVFTSPFPETVDNEGNIKVQKFSCEYDCYYCPAEPNQPRSYLLNEPGVHRANKNKFDAISQFRDRVAQYISMGHPIDKIELLVLGGTWSSYPKDYQDNFIRDIFYAANTLYEKREKYTLEGEQKLNENAECKIIGITLETRPDRINARELQNFRRLGVTRIQMGVQHTDDRILYRINRKCTSRHAIKAIKMAKDCCFKIDIHLMPDLPKPLKEGVSNSKGTFSLEDIDEEFNMVEADKKMFDTVINSPDWQADQWKIYPCEVVPWTRIETDYNNGVYKPYGHQDNKKDWTELSELLIDTMSKVKPWVRLNRIIRDIPNEYILGGNQNVSMRQDLDLEMKKRGLYCMDIRNREVKKRNIDPSKAVMKIRKYEASEGDEYFITFETEDEKILFGFLRLRLSKNSGYQIYEDEYVFPELKDCALVRELHVYGQVKKVNDNKDSAIFGNVQHMGFGKQLVNKAIEISRENNFNKIAVISGVGVKNYYRKFGFEDEKYFMTKKIDEIIPKLPSYETITKMPKRNESSNIRMYRHIDDLMDNYPCYNNYFGVAFTILIVSFLLYNYFFYNKN
jgi:ELP3 family radical SAM enzyme/protein acetyltransferase